MSEFPVFIFFMFIMLGVIFVVHRARTTDHRQRIARYVERNGGVDVRVEYIWFSGDRGSDMYRVMYTGADGTRHRTRCKINSNVFWRDDAIYWERPIYAEANTAFSSFGAGLPEESIVRASSKEEIITDLTDEVERLKLELNQFQGADSAENR